VTEELYPFTVPAQSLLLDFNSCPQIGCVGAADSDDLLLRQELVHHLIQQLEWMISCSLFYPGINYWHLLSTRNTYRDFHQGHQTSLI